MFTKRAAKSGMPLFALGEKKSYLFPGQRNLLAEKKSFCPKSDNQLACQANGAEAKGFFTL